MQQPLPPWPIEVLRERLVALHLAIAVPAPFAPRHVDNEIAIGLVVEDPRVALLLCAGAWREGVDHALRHEVHGRADPGLGGVEVFQRILLLVLPLHMLLLVKHGIPPKVQQAVCPFAAAHKEGAEVEAAAVLTGQQMRGLRDRGVAVDGHVERIVDGDILVRDVVQAREDVVFQTHLRFHDDGMQVQPPEPLGVGMLPHGGLDRIHLLPRLAPFMSIALLDAHVAHSQLVPMPLDVVALVLDGLSLQGPLLGALPGHHPAALVGGQDDDEAAVAAAVRVGAEEEEEQDGQQEEESGAAVHEVQVHDTDRQLR